MAFQTINCANLAEVNPGAVTTLWATAPLIMAMLDRILFKQPLRVNHLIGIVFILGCACSISMSSYFTEANELVKSAPVIKPWVACLVAVLTTVGFSVEGENARFLVIYRGMIPSTLGYSAFFCANTIAFIVGLFYWYFVSFNLRYLLIGTFCGFVNTLGIVSIVHGFASSAPGPC